MYRKNNNFRLTLMCNSVQVGVQMETFFEILAKETMRYLGLKNT